jgi:Ca-activated chloride channel family protein
VFPDIDTDNPELERLWALAMIEKIEALERIGTMPLSESENAIRDLGLEYQIVTDYTSMVVISDTAFADRGIERRNQTRIAREQQARAKKAQQSAKNYTVDQKNPAFKFKAPKLGGGGGAIDPMTGGLAAVLTLLGTIRLVTRRKKNR